MAGHRPFSKASSVIRELFSLESVLQWGISATGWAGREEGRTSSNGMMSRAMFTEKTIWGTASLHPWGDGSEVRAYQLFVLTGSYWIFLRYAGNPFHASMHHLTKDSTARMPSA